MILQRPMKKKKTASTSWTSTRKATPPRALPLAPTSLASSPLPSCPRCTTTWIRCSKTRLTATEVTRHYIAAASRPLVEPLTVNRVASCSRGATTASSRIMHSMTVTGSRRSLRRTSRASRTRRMSRARRLGRLQRPRLRVARPCTIRLSSRRACRVITCLPSCSTSGKIPRVTTLA